MTAAASDAALLPGFADPGAQSQRVFRRLLDALARPGRIQELPTRIAGPAPLDPATTAVALTLLDYETPVWLDAAARSAAVISYVRFHCGCPLVESPSEARFALIAAPEQAPPLSAFALGSEDYPDRSATVILQAPSLTAGPALPLRGPGIQGVAALTVAGLAADFPAQLADNHALFPCGVDLIFTCGDAVVAAPRSSQPGA